MEGGQGIRLGAEGHCIDITHGSLQYIDRNRLRWNGTLIFDKLYYTLLRENNLSGELGHTTISLCRLITREAIHSKEA